MKNHGYEYDAFISHAVEDKIAIANELCERLKSAGLKIWYSGRELNTGDSISDKILEGLDKSRYGVVILSTSYLSKSWTMKEFWLLVAKEKIDKKVILPVLHGVTVDDLAKKDLDIADRMSIPASKGIDHVVKKLLEDIHKEENLKHTNLPILKRFKRSIMMLVAFLLVTFSTSYVFYSNWSGGDPSSAFIENAINRRIEDVQAKISNQYTSEIKSAGAVVCSIDKVGEVFTAYKNLKTYYRNEYEFSNGYNFIRSKKNVEPALHIEVESMSPYNAYQFTSPEIYNTMYSNSDVKTVEYILINTQPVRFSFNSGSLIDNRYLVSVTYENNIRSLTVNFTFPHDVRGTKKHKMTLSGFLPQEVYVFEKEGGEWKLKGVE